MAESVNEVKTILRYNISIQDREFMIVITSDGVSYWDDRMQLPDLIEYTKGNISEFAISVQTPETIVLRAHEMIRKQKAEEARTGKFQRITEQTEGDDAAMDVLLELFFWNEINPLLSEPLNEPI